MPSEPCTLPNENNFTLVGRKEMGKTLVAQLAPALWCNAEN